MMRTPSKRGWRTGLLVATTLALVLAVGIMPASAARRAPEKVQGGESRAEKIERMHVIHAEVSAQLPRGHVNVPVFVDITDEDRDAINNPDTTGRVPLRIGVVKEVNGVVGKPVGRKDFQQGVLEDRAGGSFIWAVDISTPGAQAMRLHIEDFSLPGNSQLYVLGEGGQADGPYAGRGRNGNGDFWTRSIEGDRVTLAVRYTGNRPDINKDRTAFVVTEVAHVSGRPPKVQLHNHDNWPCSDNAPCMVDAECAGTDPAVNDAKAGVAKLEWIQGPFVNTCTGGLIASGTSTPYMLSANHCFSSSINNLETWFNYTTGSCNGECPHNILTGSAPPSDTVGMTMNRTSSTSDYSLFTLNEPPPAGAVFMGWNSSPVANSNGFNLYRISNANFGPQVYSEHSVDTGSPTCSGIPRGGWIYSKDTLGGTMGGSSGSPVVNGAGEIVGQLTGCCGFNCGNECDSANNWTIDGAFANYFNDVSDLLDQGGGCSTNAECDDGLFCTGTETCNGGTCQSSGDPCAAGESCNEATDTCDPPACNNDGVCGPGEDCNNCPNDCNGKVSGNPNSRFCCDGDISPDCGDARCNDPGFTCGGSTCSTNADCDDGQFCNGAEVCSGGFCASGNDPCPGQGCDENANQCVACAGKGEVCSSNGDCCSNNCKNGTCKGN